METLIHRLQASYPDLLFTEGGRLSWSPRTRTITYRNGSPQEVWGVLHELGHALLNHRTYESDISLLHMENDAWEKARAISQAYSVEIDEEHIQNCLDSYRDWLHSRSTCPRCGSHGLQDVELVYACPNCQATWKVSKSRLCRSYRLNVAQNSKSRA